jgi:uncharacterized protein (DUF433 family)
MQLNGFPKITIDPSICGGRPIVSGTRMRVTDILEMLGDGVTETEIVKDFPYISGADIRACLNYAASFANHPIVIAAE